MYREYLVDAGEKRAMPSLNELCSNLTRTTSEIRTAIGVRSDATGLLAKFWLLQDQLHRLVAHVSDNSSKADALSDICPDLVSQVIEVLSTAASLKLDKLPALRKACEHINDHLIKLEQTKQQRRTRSATAGT